MCTDCVLFVVGKSLGIQEPHQESSFEVQAQGEKFDDEDFILKSMAVHPSEEELELESAEPELTSRNLRGRRLEKLNAAQKRQIQRDKRRAITNPYRTQAEADRERWRKHRHGQNRGPQADPYEPGYGHSNFAGIREGRRRDDCASTGRGCGWRALDYDYSPHGGYDWDSIHNKHYPYIP